MKFISDDIRERIKSGDFWSDDPVRLLAAIERAEETVSDMDLNTAQRVEVPLGLTHKVEAYNRPNGGIGHARITWDQNRGPFFLVVSSESHDEKVVRLNGPEFEALVNAVKEWEYRNRE